MAGDRREVPVKEELRIRYVIEEGIDRQLDGDLVTAVLGCGWTQAWDRGFNRETGERDLAFDREEVTDVTNTGT